MSKTKQVLKFFSNGHVRHVDVGYIVVHLYSWFKVNFLLFYVIW